MQRKVYQAIANKLMAIANCQATGNVEWIERHSEALDELVSHYLPSGSGFDDGTKLDRAKSSASKLVFHTSFHHMNGDGFYDGWTAHTVTVKPSLVFGIELTVSGRDRNEIKDYIAESFHAALTDCEALEQERCEPTPEASSGMFGPLYVE